MKCSYLFKAIAGVALAAFTLASCQQKENGSVAAPTLGISAASTEFSNGKATVTLTLSAAASADVKVTLEAKGTLADKATFEKNPVIPAGVSSQSVEITVPADAKGALIVSIAAASGANVGTSYSVSLTASGSAQTASVELDYSNFNDEGKATLTAILSKKLSADVVLTIGLDENVSEGATAIPASNLTYGTTLTIPAGETEAAMEVTIKDMELLASGVNEAHFFISKAEGAELSKNVSVMVSYTVTVIQPQRIPYWFVNYNGKYDYQGQTLEYLFVSAFVNNPYTEYFYQTVISSDYYYLAVFTEEELNEFVNEEGQIDMAVLLKTIEKGVNAYCEAQGKKITDVLSTTPGGTLYSELEDGEYYIFIVDFTENGKVTGNFGISSFVVGEPEGEYAEWLGTYTLNETVTVRIDAKEKDYSYDFVIIEDGEDVWDMPAYFNSEEGRLELYFEHFFVDSNKNLYFCSGIDNNGNVASGGDNTALLATFEKTDAGYALKPYADTYEGKSGTVTTYPTNLGLLGFGKNSEGGTSFLLFSDVNLIDLPATGVKVESDPVEPTSVFGFKSSDRAARQVIGTVPFKGSFPQMRVR